MGEYREILVCAVYGETCIHRVPGLYRWVVYWCSSPSALLLISFLSFLTSLCFSRFRRASIFCAGSDPLAGYSQSVRAAADCSVGHSRVPRNWNPPRQFDDVLQSDENALPCRCQTFGGGHRLLLPRLRSSQPAVHADFSGQIARACTSDSARPYVRVSTCQSASQTASQSTVNKPACLLDSPSRQGWVLGSRGVPVLGRASIGAIESVEVGASMLPYPRHYTPRVSGYAALHHNCRGCTAPGIR